MLCIYIDRDYPKKRTYEYFKYNYIYPYIFLYEKFVYRVEFKINHPMTNRVLTYDLAFDLLKQDSSLNVVIASANNSHIYLELTELSLLWLIIFLLITLTFRRY